MAKFNFIQEDFSAGELADRAQGHISSDAYKAGLKRAANTVITQQGTVASRAGLKLLTEGNLAAAGDGSPKTLINIPDGPFGDFQLEVGTSNLRMLNRWGAIPFTPFQDLKAFFAGLAGGVNGALTDPKERRLFVNPAGVAVFTPAWATARTDAAEIYTVNFYSQSIDATIDLCLGAAVVSTYNIVSGWNTLTFHTTTVDNLKFKGGGSSFEVWGMQCYQTAGTAFGGVVWSMVANGVVAGPGTRAESFWVSNSNVGYGTPHYPNSGGNGGKYLCYDTTLVLDFFYIFIIGPTTTLRFLSWCRSPLVPSLSVWTFGTPIYEGVFGDAALTPNGTDEAKILPLPPSTTPPWMVPGAVVSIKAYQNRLWLGMADDRGLLKATAVGYGSQNGLAWDASKYIPTTMAAALSQFNSMGPVPRLSFDPGHTLIYTLDATTAAYPAAGQAKLPLPSGLPATTTFTVYLQRGGSVYRLSHKQFAVDLIGAAYAPHIALAGASTDTGTATSVLSLGALAAGDEIWVKYLPVGAAASDALDLTLARPAGAISWIEELRGLLLGSVRGERVFSSGALAIDPVTGQDFELTKYSTHGSDQLLNCLAVQDKIIFTTRGRQRLRSMGQSITTNGGLLADDISTFGEGLLAAGVRTMCYLRAPVPRLIFGFDDGTGAIATLDSKMNLAWSRFTLPTPYDIYSISAMDTEFGTELYVATSSGDVLVVLDVDSRDQKKFRSASPYGQYDAWKLPPVMDAWVELPPLGAVTYLLPRSWVGQTAAVLVNGSYRGSYPVLDTGAAGYVDIGEVLGYTWTAPSSGPLGSLNRAQTVIIGLPYPEHRFTTLPLEDVHANPVGNSQNLKSRKPQLHLRFVDSYLPLVNGVRPAENEADVVVGMPPARVTGDRRATELGNNQAAVVDVVMDLPLRMEVSAIFGGAVMNNL